MSSTDCTHKAIIRHVGKSAIKGRMSDGREVILAPEGQVQAIEAEALKQQHELEAQAEPGAGSAYGGTDRRRASVDSSTASSKGYMTPPSGHGTPFRRTSLSLPALS